MAYARGDADRRRREGGERQRGREGAGVSAEGSLGNQRAKAERGHNGAANRRTITGATTLTCTVEASAWPLRGKTGELCR
ncbi:hypothetical protein MATL_G00212940 [Megalops atlanticus]|uniref:Uncharacterized protein n=1 Tax=Megalops atlanticus TaxID=7932 RepID=A0A9D3SZB6_MEGAT|nr:hypothetical protein MATL_G00212940 [Megalops atlanticus]